MLFPVMRYETKYGIDYRVGATEANIRSGSQLIGYIEDESKPKAIRQLKTKLAGALKFYPNSNIIEFR